MIDIELIDAKLMPVVYLACPVSAPDRHGVQENLARAERWYRFLVVEIGVSVSAPWLTSCRVLDELDPEHRRIGMKANYAQLVRADAFFLAGGRLSSGMAAELDVFKPMRGGDRVFDFSWFWEPDQLRAYGTGTIPGRLRWEIYRLLPVFDLTS